MAVDERGDFQTPDWLARRVAALVPPAAALVEPTCGDGSMLAAALERAGQRPALGIDIDAEHVARARARLGAGARIETGDVFAVDWSARLAELPQPIGVIGNPPWVTSAALGRSGGSNLPAKSAAHVAHGDPRTGASNFDVCEWIIDRLARALDGRRGWIAMLCKTHVARRVLSRLWREGPRPERAEMFGFDAREAWSVAVDACLLVVELGPDAGDPACTVYPELARTAASGRFGLRDGQLVSDLGGYDRYRHLAGEGLRWRSGIKHDCADVMELSRERAAALEIEPAVLYPMLKSAELARGAAPTRCMLVPQTRANGDPAELAERAPRAWRYLVEHGARLDQRKSRVYRGRPRFSIFGVGDYSFAPWKIAISGFYKRLDFRLLGPHLDRPVVLDDTSYLAAFDDRAQAEAAHRLLSSAPAQAFLAALAFWDGKRPITARLLGRLSLPAVARELHERQRSA